MSKKRKRLSSAKEKSSEELLIEKLKTKKGDQVTVDKNNFIALLKEVSLLKESFKKQKLTTVESSRYVNLITEEHQNKIFELISNEKVRKDSFLGSTFVWDKEQKSPNLGISIYGLTLNIKPDIKNPGYSVVTYTYDVHDEAQVKQVLDFVNDIVKKLDLLKKKDPAI